MKTLGRGIYCKLSALMITQADDMARARCPDAADMMDEGLVKETVKCRCERAARIFIAPVDYVVVTSGLHVPEIDPAKFYVFVGASGHPYYWIAGWLKGDEMKGKITPDMLHKPYQLMPALRRRNG